MYTGLEKKELLQVTGFKLHLLLLLYSNVLDITCV